MAQKAKMKQIQRIAIGVWVNAGQIDDVWIA